MCEGDPDDGYVTSTADELFPACAGVILDEEIKIGRVLTFPRMCGGDP